MVRDGKRWQEMVEMTRDGKRWSKIIRNDGNWYEKFFMRDD